MRRGEVGGVLSLPLLPLGVGVAVGWSFGAFGGGGRGRVVVVSGATRIVGTFFPKMVAR